MTRAIPFRSQASTSAGLANARSPPTRATLSRLLAITRTLLQRLSGACWSGRTLTDPKPPTPQRYNIAHITLLVRDYDEAIAWYTGKLGFTLVQDTPLPEQGKRWVVIAPPGATAGAATLLLARAPTPEQAAFIGNQARGRVFLFLHTDDFRRDYDAFRDRGVRFVRVPQEQPYGTVAVFEDLYGNLWDLVQPAAA